MCTEFQVVYPNIKVDVGFVILDIDFDFELADDCDSAAFGERLRDRRFGHPAGVKGWFVVVEFLCGDREFDKFSAIFGFGNLAV